MNVPILGGLKQPANFYFIRHGESEGNKTKTVQGHVNMPLTDKGREQAEKAGLWLKERGIQKIVASSLDRARETGEIAHRQIFGEFPETASPTFLLSDDLKEIDTGIFSGKTFSEVELLHQEAYEVFRRKSWEGVPDAETIADLEARALRHWKKLEDLANAGANTILSVSHGGFFQWLFRVSFGISWKAWMPLLSVGNCAISHFFAEPVLPGPKELRRHEQALYAEWKLVNFTAYQK